MTDVEEISGHGITAKVDGVSVAAGNYKLMKKLGLSYSETDKVGTIVHIAIDGRYEGYILISDKIKPTSAAAIKALKKAGIKGTIMLTGDSRTVADSVAAELGIDEVYSELLPGDKVAKVEELLARKGSKEKSSPSSETESTMHRCSQEQISELQWAPWVQMQQIEARYRPHG